MRFSSTSLSGSEAIASPDEVKTPISNGSTNINQDFLVLITNLLLCGSLLRHGTKLTFKYDNKMPD
jgi:hypothetical protein